MEYLYCLKYHKSYPDYKSILLHVHYIHKYAILMFIVINFIKNYSILFYNCFYIIIVLYKFNYYYLLLLTLLLNINFFF